MLSFMMEVSNGKHPTASDYPLNRSDFCDIIEDCQNEGLIKGFYIKRNQFKDVIFTYTECVKLTLKGMEYLDKYSSDLKNYKSVKASKQWLNF